MSEPNYLTERFEENRSHLRGVAYRMLGSASEADDAVQEAWLRLNRTDTTAIDNLGGWLTTVVARVSLDMLRSRKSRREDAFTPETPEPVATGKSGSSPEREAMLADSVGLALLVVLDRLTPAERLAFVLHDMFGMPFEEIAPIVGRSEMATRQLASRARRRVRGGEESPSQTSSVSAKSSMPFLLLYAAATSKACSPSSIPISWFAPTAPSDLACRRPRSAAPQSGKGSGHLWAHGKTRPTRSDRRRRWSRDGPAGTTAARAPFLDREWKDHRDRSHRRSGAAWRARVVDRRVRSHDLLHCTSARPRRCCGDFA